MNNGINQHDIDGDGGLPRRSVLKTVGTVGLLSTLPGIGSARSDSEQRNERIDVQRWRSLRDFATGEFRGVRPARGGTALTVAYPIGQYEYTDPFGNGTKAWEYARWTSRMSPVGFGAKQLVASWTADTPEGTWLQVEMRGATTGGELTDWYAMGRWAATDVDIHRTSVSSQGDDHGYIAIDTFKAADGVALGAYQLRVSLYRLPENDASPVLRSVSAMASHLPEREHVDASPLGGAEGITLDVPEYSQSIHDGEYPRWDGGGEAWCSPTSTAMVVSYWGRGPTEEQMSWVNPEYEDPQVDFAARGTFDYSYDGAGNWPFNVAYAGRFGLDGFVTRLRSLNELEGYIKAGVPVITSQSFEEEELPGAGYGTNGHLMVVVGFTEDGDVVANDPVAPTDEEVRLVYPRANFENVWQRTTGTGGIAYIIHPPGHDLPDGAPGDGHGHCGEHRYGRRQRHS